MYYFSLADFVFTSECPHYSRVLFFTFMSTCTTQQKIQKIEDFCVLPYVYLGVKKADTVKWGLRC